MIKRSITILAVLSLAVGGCATTRAVPEKTQLQIREFQTRSYDTDNVKMVLKAVLNVLQDDYYIVRQADAELGFLTAAKEVDVENKGEAFLAVLLLGGAAKWKKNSIIECTANVSEYGSQTRVRVNFQMKTLDNRGGVLSVYQIEDEKFYQEFFAKVDKGIFIQKENL